MSDTTFAQPHSASTEASNTGAQGAFIWYELITPDAVAAKTFYDAVVGWTIEPQPSGEMDYRMITRADGGNAGGVMRLTDEMRGHGARPIWLGYVGVDDVDASVASIETAGGKALMPAFDIPDVGRIVMVTDPQGTPFYVMTPTPPADRPASVSDVFDPVKAQHVRWNELATADQDAAVQFYTSHFGWAQEGGMDMGEMGQYLFVQQNGVGIGAIMRKPPQLPVSLWTYYFGVDDIDRAQAAVTAGGGQILHGPMEIPGGEFSLNGLDPQGASFGLVGPRKS
ncbi:VOC family protein [Sphingomonas sp.]|uniref:VOC family protein n=1 Tax=Sphingomonas sp. TaxID=28214 RepID=UPI00286A1E32|nr:VOC family protein [Sphingomonas sp.]